MRISISTHIYKTLTEDANIVKAVGKKIYPIATKSEVKFPFIVYERENVDTRYDKAGASITNIDESIYILAEGYTESLEIAEMVIAALDRKKASYKGFEVIDATLNDVPETYVSQTYVQQVRMRFTIKEN
jgi:hypothetical protein